MKILKPDSDIFSELPSEIILNILSRIPIKTVYICKCVCKSWLSLLKTPEFARSHLSKSEPGLVIHYATIHNPTEILQTFEFEDSLEVHHRDLHYRKILELDMEKSLDLSRGSGIIIKGSANGLLFLKDLVPGIHDHYVCNPMTREYIRLPKSERMHQYPTIDSYGFGVSRLSNQYKVVKILHYRVRDPDTGSFSIVPKSVWEVYTLGTESWRSITTPCDMLLDHSLSYNGTFSNGNLHWLATDLRGSWWVSCFDLETEGFSKFRPPIVESKKHVINIGVLRDRLSFFDDSSATETSIYLMGDYGDEKKSWNKEYVISKFPDAADIEWIVPVYAVQAFGDGNLLLAWLDLDSRLFWYYNRTKTMSPVELFDEDVACFPEAISYIPSLISLKALESKTVRVGVFRDSGLR